MLDRPVCMQSKSYCQRRDLPGKVCPEPSDAVLYDGKETSIVMSLFSRSLSDANFATPRLTMQSRKWENFTSFKVSTGVLLRTVGLRSSIIWCHWKEEKSLSKNARWSIWKQNWYTLQRSTKQPCLVDGYHRFLPMQYKLQSNDIHLLRQLSPCWRSQSLHPQYIILYKMV